MNILWKTAQNVYIISDFNTFSELDVNVASQYMTWPHDHHHSSFRYTRNADTKINSHRPLVRTNTICITIVKDICLLFTQKPCSLPFSVREAAHDITQHGKYTKQGFSFTQYIRLMGQKDIHT
jgi:hypothetical protein